MYSTPSDLVYTRLGPDKRQEVQYSSVSEEQPYSFSHLENSSTAVRLGPAAYSVLHREKVVEPAPTYMHVSPGHDSGYMQVAAEQELM